MPDRRSTDIVGIQLRGVAQYRRAGFLSPLPGLSRDDVASCRGKLEAFEATIGGPVTLPVVDPRYRYRTHALLSWVYDPVRHSASLEATADLIAPDLLVYMTTWFIKEPDSEAITVCHQDATYFGLRPHRSAVVAAPVPAGGFSLPHTLCLHQSQPNRTSERRMGLAISYIPTPVRHTGGVPVLTFSRYGIGIPKPCIDRNVTYSRTF
ncbi:hypothetical protein NKDENANG_03826 [Candidatus Entotheonellaceae bacterium PAL068K]